jgi:hypothetical protein
MTTAAANQPIAVDNLRLRTRASWAEASKWHFRGSADDIGLSAFRGLNQDFI